MLIPDEKLSKGMLVYRGVLFDYLNGYTYGPCYNLKVEAIEWAEKELARGDYPIDCQKMVMWKTCEADGQPPTIEGAKCDALI